MARWPEKRERHGERVTYSATLAFVAALAVAVVIVVLKGALL